MAREEVEVVLPDALFGGDPRGFLGYLGLHGRPIGNNRWTVWPNNDKTFISHHGLADDTAFVNRFDNLKKMPLSSPHLDDPETLDRLAELEERLAERMSGGADIAAHFHSIQASILKCGTHEELIDAVEQACALLSTAASDETNELLFAGLSAHLVIATDLLVRRVRLPAILFRFDQDPDAIKTITSLGDQGGYFASSTKWFHDVISASHYFGPLLGCLAPGFWCVPSGRPPAAVLFSLGTALAGYRQNYGIDLPDADDTRLR